MWNATRARDVVGDLRVGVELVGAFSEVVGVDVEATGCNVYPGGAVPGEEVADLDTGRCDVREVTEVVVGEVVTVSRCLLGLPVVRRGGGEGVCNVPASLLSVEGARPVT